MKNLKAKVSHQIIEQVSTEKLDYIISKNNYTIIDVRSPMDIETQGTIPGAINIPLDNIDDAVDKNKKEYNPVFDSSGPFLFCCTGGVMSYMASIKVQEKGIKNVFNLAGGHSAWLKTKEGLSAV